MIVYREKETDIRLRAKFRDLNTNEIKKGYIYGRIKFIREYDKRIVKLTLYRIKIEGKTYTDFSFLSKEYTSKDPRRTITDILASLLIQFVGEKSDNFEIVDIDITANEIKKILPILRFVLFKRDISDFYADIVIRLTSTIKSLIRVIIDWILKYKLEEKGNTLSNLLSQDDILRIKSIEEFRKLEKTLKRRILVERGGMYSNWFHKMIIKYIFEAFNSEDLISYISTSLENFSYKRIYNTVLDYIIKHGRAEIGSRPHNFKSEEEEEEDEEKIEQEIRNKFEKEIKNINL